MLDIWLTGEVSEDKATRLLWIDLIINSPEIHKTAQRCVVGV
jgi:hypothetical protein